MTPDQKTELQQIRDAVEIGELDGWTRGNIEFLLELVPPGIDAQIDSAEEQKIVDQQRIKQAEKIIGAPKSIEEAIKLAVSWCATAMQETCNADYWKERTKEAERIGLYVTRTKDGSVHITAPPEGLVLTGVTIKGADAPSIEGDDDE